LVVAKFQVEHAEGMRWITVTLDGETVRAERGALNHMVGNITMDTPLPSIRAILLSYFSEESLLRPYYKGTGELHLESSLGGFHTFQVNKGEAWILQSGAYWASEERIALSVHRERFWTALWAGEGLFWFKTRVSGEGQVVLIAQGPVQELTLNNERLVVDGNYVVARTSGILFSIRRPARSLLGYFLSGERYARVYQGTGRVLIATTPYWRLRIGQKGESRDPAAFEPI
jgi:uncharacterized protein (AIM24 family)